MSENPYLSSEIVGPEAETHDPTGDTPTEPAARPRIWTVFTVAVIGLVAGLAVQIVCTIVLVVWLMTQGAAVDDVDVRLLDTISQPGVFIVVGLSAQLVFLAGAVIPALLSPAPWHERLGLVRGRLSGAGYLLVMIGSLVPLAIGVSLAYLLSLIIPPDPTFQMLYENMTLGWAIPFVIFIAVAPGICEELLFRGYIQTRLLQRWKPWLAVLVTSVMFAIYHVMPHPVALAFVVGFWLGYVAWRSGSVLPGICCHAFVNGIWNIWNIGILLGAFPAQEETPLPVVVGVGAVAVACFLYTTYMLWKLPDGDDPVTVDPYSSLPLPGEPDL